MPTVNITSSSSQLRAKVTANVPLVAVEIGNLNRHVWVSFALHRETRARIALPRYQVIDTSRSGASEYCYVLGISRRALLTPVRDLQHRLVMCFDLLEWGRNESAALYRFDNDPTAAKRSLISVVSSNRPARDLILEHMKLTWEREVREDADALRNLAGLDRQVDRWRERRIGNRCAVMSSLWGVEEDAGRAIGPTETQPAVIVVWDPELMSESDYAALVNGIGDLVRAEGGVGVDRIRSSGFGVPLSEGALI